ncbi:MAG: hypothetical protein L0206_18235, partial [Actinobacteria bacterium]|nr:hypothetical protein [Actinomycetota bacterium]
MATIDDTPEKKGSPSIGDILFYVVLFNLFLWGSVFAFLHKDGHDLRVNGVLNYEALGILVATGLTLALYSFLYKDNPFFKAAENLYVGVG